MLAIVGLSMALGQSARAAEFDLDFEDRSGSALGVEFFGTSEWRDSRRCSMTTGYLSITDALKVVNVAQSSSPISKTALT